MKWIAGFLLSSVLSAGAASAGTVTGVQGNAASVAVGAVLSVTVSGTNPCGAAHINYGDGTAITYAITGLPVTQTHTYDKPGTYAIVARGMGNCDGEATTRVQVTGPAPPPPPAPAPAAAISAIAFTPRPGIVRQPVTIDIAGHGACAITVAFGDGNQQELNGALPLRHHVYNAPGTYSITAIATGTCQGRARRDLDVR